MQERPNLSILLDTCFTSSIVNTFKSFLSLDAAPAGAAGIHDKPGGASLVSTSLLTFAFAATFAIVTTYYIITIY
jgi:hypothetical protein